MKHKFNASYDKEGDILTIYRKDILVKESIEVSEDLIIDVDKDMRLVNLELVDAYKFLHTSNNKISKVMLEEINQIELDVRRFRNYWFITLVFKFNDEIIEEKLPAFANNDFKSPLVASAEI